MVFRLLIILLIAFPLAGISQESDSLSTAEIPNSEPRTYKVQKGDNLFRIALNHGITLDALLKANEIDAEETKISVGQELIIPDPPKDTEPTEAEIMQQELGYYQWKKNQLDQEMDEKQAISDSLRDAELQIMENINDSINQSQAVDSGNLEDPEMAAKLAEIEALQALIDSQMAEQEKLKAQLAAEQEKVQEMIREIAESDSSFSDMAPAPTEFTDEQFEKFEVVDEGEIVKEEKIEVETITATGAAMTATEELTGIDSLIALAEANVFQIEADIQALNSKRSALEREQAKFADQPIDQNDINAILNRMEASKQHAQKMDEINAEIEAKEIELEEANEAWSTLLRQKEMEQAGLLTAAEVIEEEEESVTDVPEVLVDPNDPEHLTSEDDGVVTEIFLSGSTTAAVAAGTGSSKKKGNQGQVVNQPDGEIDFDNSVFSVDEVSINEEVTPDGVIDTTSMIKAEFFLARALGEINQQNYKSAQKYIEKSLKLNPKYIEAQMLHGDINSAFGMYEDAQKDYLKVIAIDSLVPQAYYNLAQCLAFQGKDQKAYQNYNKALSLDNEYILALSGRAAMFLKFKDYRSALKDYSRIIEICLLYTSDAADE